MPWIDHPNIFMGSICCDLLRHLSHLERGYTGGYTPAFTLRGLFLQFLTFFSTTSVDQDEGYSIEIGERIMSKYALDRDLDPWGKTKVDFSTNQTELRRQWQSDTRPETTLAVFRSGDGEETTHTVKSKTPDSNRVHCFRKPNPRWSSTYEKIRHYKCGKCPYGSLVLPHRTADRVVTPKAPDSAEPSSAKPCLLHILTDDTLLEIASHMQSETIITFGKAYPYFHRLVADHHIFILRELRCFFLKTPLSEGILGIGVAYDAKQRLLSSDFDWLSLAAFEDHQVRKSIQKRDFEFFLPLAFNRANFNHAREEIWVRVTELDAAVRKADAAHNASRSNQGGTNRTIYVVPRAEPHKVFEVLYRMMNNIVVSLMKSCDDTLIPAQRRSAHSAPQPTLLNASERAIISYCHLMHLLTYVARASPAFLADAEARVGAFVASPPARLKSRNPDLGELIVIITLVLIMSPKTHEPGGPSWSSIAGAFLEEVVIRNVRWVLREAPELEVMEQGPSDYRLETTFKRSRTSLRLIMFQITFLNLFIQTYRSSGKGIEALDANFGFPEADLPQRMVEEIKAIYKVNSWPTFFAKVQYERGFSKATFSQMLRTAVATSAERRYHVATRNWRDLERLRVLRKELERASQEAKARAHRP